MFKLSVGNDNGNNAQKLCIDGEVFEFPNLYLKAQSLPKGIIDTVPETIMKDLYNNLFVTIKSPALESNCPQSFYIGNYTTKAGRAAQNMSIGIRGNKLKTDLPLITTLANISAYVVKKAYEKEKDIEKLCRKTLEASIDMATALPDTIFGKDTAKTFSDTFTGEHLVTVYLGEKEVNVKLNIEYVKVLPEGVPTAFYLLSNAGKQSEYLKQFDFNNKSMLHVSIGDGTTEYPITEGVNFIPDFNYGTHNGIGIAIEKIINDFKAAALLSKCSRQDISAIIRNKYDRNHDRAMEMVEPYLEEEAQEIKDETFTQLQRFNNNVDFIVVYGGGSILLEPYIKEAFMNDALMKSEKNPRGIELVYVPAEIATTIEAQGLYIFTQQNFFKEAAKKAKEESSNEKKVG